MTKRWRHLRWRLEAVFWLGLARCAVRCLPFRWISPRLGHHQAESPATISPQQQRIGERVSTLIQRSSRRTPWRSNCLAQAIACTMMLRRRGVSSTLYLGAKMNDGQLAAHAWTRSGPLYLTGDQDRPGFAVVEQFANLPGTNPKRRADD